MRHFYFNLITLTLTFFISQSYAQITFENFYGGPKTDSGRDIQLTSDGGYLIAGISNSFSAGDTDIYVLKINNAGAKEWDKTIGGKGTEEAFSMVSTSDGNFVIAGTTTSFGNGESDSYLIKIKPSGDTLWTRTYGSSGIDVAREIIETSDKGFIITGYTFKNGNMDAFLTKTDMNGKEIWTQTYGTTSFDKGYSVKQTSDGGYILLGATLSVGSGDCYLVKTKDNGDVIWTKTFGNPFAEEEGQSVQITLDGGYIFTADSQLDDTNFDIYTVRCDKDGIVIWEKTYGGDEKDVVKMISPAKDGNYILAGISRSFGWINPDMWLVKIDYMTGNLIWSHNYGKPNHEHCYAIKQTSDGIIAVGHSDNSGSYDVYVVKTNNNGTLGPLGIDQNFINENISVFPNPCEKQLNIYFSEDISSTVTISDITGKIIFYTAIKNEKSTIDVSLFNNGLYNIQIKDSKYSTVRKLIISH